MDEHEVSNLLMSTIDNKNKNRRKTLIIIYFYVIFFFFETLTHSRAHTHGKKVDEKKI